MPMSPSVCVLEAIVWRNRGPLTRDEDKYVERNRKHSTRGIPWHAPCRKWNNPGFKFYSEFKPVHNKETRFGLRKREGNQNEGRRERGRDSSHLSAIEVSFHKTFIIGGSQSAPGLLLKRNVVGQTRRIKSKRDVGAYISARLDIARHPRLNLI
jgi:hypothetical protein